MLKKIHHYIVRFIYVRHVNIFGWPSRRMRAVWWLYELRYKERWLKVANGIVELNKAVHAWVAALPRS